MNLTKHRDFVFFSTVFLGILFSVGMTLFMIQVNNGPLPIGFLIYLVALSFVAGFIGGEGTWRILNWCFGSFRDGSD